ncbi:putative invertase inhibitor [Triticum dicoccoides]|uniref:putative invertase inhibitor n=1 Tax=Triticum dicoccoides TaxID=85692 RepID=UPI00162DBA61|nr:putative invertase inhibitor [Triticum dicoccoides]
MGPSRALPCLVLLFLLSSSRASVLEDTCKSFADGNPGVGYDYCIKFFQASKDSATADKRGLAIIASKLTGAAAKSIGKHIQALKASEKDKHIQSGLNDCGDLYSQAVDLLDVAAKGVAAGTPRGKLDAVANLSGALVSPQTCEDGFSELGVKSPLSAEDSEFTKEVSIALVITNSL